MVLIRYHKCQHLIIGYNIIWHTLGMHIECQHTDPINESQCGVWGVSEGKDTQSYCLLSSYCMSGLQLRVLPASFQCLCSVSWCYGNLCFADGETQFWLKSQSYIASNWGIWNFNTVFFQL